MKTKQLWHLLAIGAITIALTLGLTIYINRTSSPTSGPQQGTEKTETISLTIEDLYEDKQVAIALEETVLQVLQTQNAEDPELQLSTKDYAGLGTLIEGIGRKKNGTDKKYWQYKVNGVMPQVGADKYKLTNGESVEWFFDASRF